MSTTPNQPTPGSGVPAPREVWRAALTGRNITIHVQPAHREGTIQFSGEVTTRRKDGTANYTFVTVGMLPHGELAGVEIEAEKDRDGWGPFRAFHWRQPPHAHGPTDYCFQYIGTVTHLTMDGIRTTPPTPHQPGGGA